MPASRRAASSRPPPRASARVSLARALSKLGLCSRTEAARLIAAGRVQVDGRVARDAALRVDPARSRIRVDEAAVRPAAKGYWMMNKPRGVVTTRSDPEGRPTVHDRMRELGLPWAGAVGRLDRASEGLLLLSNDGRWADALLDPRRAVVKTYHVQVEGRIAADGLERLQAGVTAGGETLRAHAARLLRAGPRNCWLEIELDEGRNRQIRRMLDALGFATLRLVRVAIGPLTLGALGKNEVRALTSAEVAALGQAAGRRRAKA